MAAAPWLFVVSPIVLTATAPYLRSHVFAMFPLFLFQVGIEPKEISPNRASEFHESEV